MKKVLLITIMTLAFAGALFAGGADEGPMVATSGEMAEKSSGS